MSQGKPRGRSVEAKRRRAPTVRRVINAQGRRIVCEVCHELHPPPVCLTAERVRMTVDLPSWLHQVLHARVEWGERSPWVVRQIRKGLDL